MSRKWLSAAIVMLCVGSCFAAPASADRNPAWCQPGYVCLTNAEAGRVLTRLIDLEAMLAAARAKQVRRFGMTVGCGVGAVPEISSTQLAIGAAPSCGIYWGWRIGLYR